MTISQIREKYLRYFADHGHAILPSASILPENDPTTLFTGSGMQPMVSYLLGEPHPRGVRIADSQKCFRSQDIDEVGDNRHTTFFEMLGNWSLGDYFKQEQISWMFEFLTKELGLDPKNLYVTVFKGNAELAISKDEESVGLWQTLFASKGIVAEVGENPEQDGMRTGERIFYYSEKKNWWSRSGVPANMPVGEPGGPDTEMFWDFGAERALHETSEWSDKPCHVNCDCGRFVEIGNNVFMQYAKTNDGFQELPQKNVDFGGGLERMAAAVKGDPDIFLIDIFHSAIQELTQMSGKQYQTHTHAYRVILDHLRAATFLIGDGVYPSNKDQGYFVRRLIRRAVRFAHQLGITENVCAIIGKSFIEVYAEAYPNLSSARENILAELEKEEKKFQQTLKQGMKKFVELLNASSDKIITGTDAFELVQSYGFPVELTQELAEENGYQVDLETFKMEKEKHQALSRTGSEQKFKGGLADHSDMSVKYHTATHLLHKALRQVLGETVSQKGSNITPERLRFDFSFPTKLEDEQVKQVEDLVNEAIQKKMPVHFEMLTLEEAGKRGAIGLFADKYAEVGDQVKVYFVGDDSVGGVYSSEVCGGPHVSNTIELGKFEIQKEESIGSGLRRIKAILK